MSAALLPLFYFLGFFALVGMLAAIGLAWLGTDEEPE